MDVFSVSVIAVTAAGVAACGALAWRAIKAAPEGYEDGEGLHLGPTPKLCRECGGPLEALRPFYHREVAEGVCGNPGCALYRIADNASAPVVDFGKPLELEDGTPLVLCDPAEQGPSLYGGNPDRDGGYWVKREDGKLFAREQIHGPMQFACVGNAGKAYLCYGIRNRAEAPAVANDNLPKLTYEQARVLAEMHGEISYPAAKLASWTGLSEKAVTKARKELKALGLVEYGTLRGDGGESHEIAGRGYWLTAAGRKAQDALAVEGAA